jgi:hypothetical protein
LAALLEHFLHNLLFLDQERADYPILDAVCASRTTIGALDGLLGAGNGGVLARTEGGNLIDKLEMQLQMQMQFAAETYAGKFGSAITACSILVSNITGSEDC